jgi:hypothetical protein
MPARIGNTGVAGADAPATYNSSNRRIGVTVGTTANTVAAGDDRRITGYTHEQATPALVWTINHALNGYPAVVVIDASGSVVIPDVGYPSLNTVTISFAGETRGRRI